MDWGRKAAGLFLLALFAALLMNDTVQSYLKIPNQITTFETAAEYFKKAEKDEDWKVTDITPSSAAVKAGMLPAKRTEINKIPELRVIPGGQSIGVKLQSKGVMIIGFHDILSDGRRYSPAEEAGLEAGDQIIEMDGEEIKDLEDVVKMVDNKEKNEIKVKVRRKQKVIEKKIPLHSEKDKKVMGAYIRNAASGIGTLSFYEPDEGKFGALGHVIADADTKKPISVDNGKVMKSSVTSIERGSDGKPGEKQASLSRDQEPLGNVTKNTSFGVFGTLSPDKLNEREPMPVAFADEVKTGPAKILTVLEGEKVEAFDIEIVQSMPQMKAASKGMVIKVKDDELMEKTGGIIQGMSGSPIIQNGKIAGAVTHVFVNDSSSGYACHIEWMLEEAGIDTFQEQRNNAAS
ncbi:SpoIVB peptidase [Salibacterium halotolerans]|uniref:Stage IV sporulation protein B n=1 Tax=Salibacterium halotolerans TaxID=1884432 RepID=A0A1I5NPU2_9BACI|nr:SpoIVB peptidase [Salibacterium halotolerans]SFP23823.1 stage IV sporulation protein B [Salibacterium halotolerans]